MDKLRTPEEMADLLGVKLSTIYNWTHTEYIPHIKVGRLVRFRESDVMKWLDKRSCPGRRRKTLTANDLGLSREHDRS